MAYGQLWANNDTIVKEKTVSILQSFHILNQGRLTGVLSRCLGFSMTWVMMAILVVFSAGLLLYSSVKIKRELRKQLEETVKFAQTSLPTAIWQLNYSSMNDVLQAILITNVIAAAQILAEERIVATQTAPAYAGEKFSFFEGSKHFLVRSVAGFNMERKQVDQVLQNLVLNADQAMPEGGTLSLSCRNQVISTGQIAGLEPGKYVRVEVRDNGCGIEPENIDRIFDPYFSTKEKDSTKGSGLGLSITHSIIAKYNGQIAVRSLPGQGTTFTLYLPAIAEEVTADNEAGSGLVFGSGTIMVMDDEEMVRGVACEMLTHLGYDCLKAEDGSEAITLYEKSLNNGKKIDALIMDLTIPGGMGGKEAMRQLLRLDPQAKGIVSSGYSHDQLLHDYPRAGFSGIVSKPYQLQELSQALSAVLPVRPILYPTRQPPATLNEDPPSGGWPGGRR